MKNLNSLPGSQIAEYDLIQGSKNNPARTRLLALRPSINTDYNLYLTNFTTIHTIATGRYSVQEHSDLQSCYTGTTKALSNLLARIIEAQSVEFQYICAYCQFYTVSTIDHHIPEGAHPEYCVMPQNLIPCCFVCNTIKNQYWRNSQQTSRLFIHFYNDVIPNLVFLRCILSFQGVVPSISYSLAQPVGMSNSLYTIISTHFNRLGLLELYSKNIGIVISEIKKSVIAARAVNANLTTAEISNVLVQTSNVNKNTYGINYWQSLAIDLLATSQVFLSGL